MDGRNSKCWYVDVCSQECSDSCIRYLEMKHLMDSSKLPLNKQIPALLDAGEDYEQFLKLAEIKNSIVEFVKSGKNLYITSNYTGNGKTSWAIKLMLKYFDEIWAGNGFKTRALFVHVPTFLLHMKDFNNPMSEEYKTDLLNCDLVVWDDIASVNMSNYDFSQLLMYIDGRLLQTKSNIFTSNINSVKSLQEHLGIKLASRIYNTSEIVELRGKDRRTHGTATDNQ